MAKEAKKEKDIKESDQEKKAKEDEHEEESNELGDHDNDWEWKEEIYNQIISHHQPLFYVETYNPQNQTHKT